MKKSLLSASLKYLIDYSKYQFKNNTGLHLNSNEWKSYIKLGPVKNYKFLINGDISFITHTTNKGTKYNQIIKICDYKKFESALLVLYLLNVDEETIISFIKECFMSSNARIYCQCAAATYWGVNYNLGNIKSNYGKAELRPPKIRDPKHNNLLCKHLWVILTNFENEIDKFIKDLLPYYKRYFGLSSLKSIERTQKELGEKGIRRTIGNALKQLLKINNKKLTDKYNKLVENKLNDLFKQVKEVEQTETVKSEPLTNKDKTEVNKQVEKIDEEINNEETDNEKINEDENAESKDNGTTQ